MTIQRGTLIERYNMSLLAGGLEIRRYFKTDRTAFYLSIDRAHYKLHEKTKDVNMGLNRAWLFKLGYDLPTKDKSWSLDFSGSLGYTDSDWINKIYEKKLCGALKTKIVARF